MITLFIFYGDMYIVLQTAVIFPDAGLTLPSRPLNGVIFLKFIKFLCVCVWCGGVGQFLTDMGLEDDFFWLTFGLNGI